jgi:hypothetical protein
MGRPLSRSAERKGLVHGTLYATAHDRAASRHVNSVADSHSSEAMARCEHGCILLPRIFLRVIGLILAEHAVRPLTPHHENLAAVIYGSMAGARRRQRITRLPFVLCRVVGVMQVRVGVEAVDTATDDVNAAPNGERGMTVLHTQMCIRVHLRLFESSGASMPYYETQG